MKKFGIFGILVIAVLLLVGCGKQSVAFDAQNETPIFLQEVSKGNTLEQPATPSREGYDFLGWYTDISGGERWDFSSPVSSDLNLYGQWEPLLFSVEFIFNTPHSASLKKTVAYEEQVQAPDIPDNVGYRFTGWYSNPQLTEPWDAKQPIVEETHVYAGWEQLFYVLRYHVDEGVDASFPAEQSYPAGTAVQIVDSPFREGYRFAGWSTQEDGGGTIYLPGQALVMKTEAVDLYAQWTRPVASIDAGSFHSLALLVDGTLMVTGNNASGQLGNGSREGQTQSVAVAQDVRTMSAGGGHSLYIDSDGVLWGMGANFEGQLGNSSPSPKTTPIQIIEGIIAVSAGGTHSLVLKNDDTLWAMGNNEDGQLGDGTTINRSKPVRIASQVKEISAGLYHSLFVKTDGSLWAMGWNEYGQLGDGSNTSRNKPVRIDNRVEYVSAGENHSLYLKDDGSVWAMGANTNGQLGDGSNQNRSTPVMVAEGVLAVEAGASHSLYIGLDGSLWGTGDNNAQQLVVEGTPGYNEWTQIGEKVMDISAGAEFTLILGMDEVVRAYGANNYGQLGEWKE